jgi:hypothetical protein
MMSDPEQPRLLKDDVFDDFAKHYRFSGFRLTESAAKSARKG